jgi:hypothetical protein
MNRKSTGPLLAAAIISISFGYGFVTRKRAVIENHHHECHEHTTSNG